MSRQIILKSREEIKNFLENKEVFNNSDIVWKCPKCNRENIGAYFSHSVKCECNQFILPRLSDLICDPNAENLIRNAEIKELKDKILCVKGQILSLEQDIIDKEAELLEYKRELRGWLSQVGEVDEQ